MTRSYAIATACPGPDVIEVVIRTIRAEGAKPHVAPPVRMTRTAFAQMYRDFAALADQVTWSGPAVDDFTP